MMPGVVVEIDSGPDSMKPRNVAVLALMPDAMTEEVVERIGQDYRVLLPDPPLRETPTEDNLRTFLAEADGVLIGPGKLTKSVFDAAPRLQVVSTFGSGLGYRHD
jgi:phosphoglycerate dehydrogenase-like enzyme